METSNLPDKEVNKQTNKKMVIRRLIKLESEIEELKENFNKEFESIRKNQTDLKHTITEMKNV